LQVIIIEIRDYDANWPRQYERRALTIRHALGLRALAIDHVGSTSVPGLAAKPVLDILLTMADSTDEMAYSPLLQQIGFELKVREPDWFEHRMFRGTAPATNLHVLSAGCTEIQRTLTFRDWIRANPQDRMIYENEKRRLALQPWQTVQNYADAKAEVIAAILQRAWPSNRNQPD
jgi:GrpB-like predicted nucleotidyltransferase (UPF0157 family)